MSLPELAPLLLTAFMAGLMGSGHCFGMCGGIASVLGSGLKGRGSFTSALVLNLSRMTSYVCLGGIVAVMMNVSGQVIGLPQWSQVLRILSAVLILLIGLRFLFNWVTLAWLEKSGARLWARIAPFAGKAARKKTLAGRMVLGLCWGLLPCGLVYTILLTAASTSNGRDGALVMGAFGLGTLPAMLGLTLWAPALTSIIQDRTFRRVIGLALVLLSIWALLMALGLTNGGHHH